MKTNLLFRLAALVVFLPGMAPAATRTWDGGDPVNTNWNDPQNWESDAVPVANDTLVFPVGSPAIAAADKATNNNFAVGTDFAGLSFTSNSYTVAGNAFDVGAGGINVTYTGSGNVIISPALALLAAQSWQTGNTGSTLRLDGTVNLNGRALAVGGAGMVVFAADITGDAGSSLVVNSPTRGTRILASGSATFTGPTTVQSGVLEVDGEITVSTVTLQAGAVLGGDGSAASVVSQGGAIQPGRAAGGGDNAARFVVTGTLTCDAATTVIIEIISSLPADLDQVRVDGAISLNNAALTLDTSSLTGSGWDTWTIIENNSALPVTGTFAGMPEHHVFTANSRNFIISYKGGDGNDVVITRFFPPTGTTKTWAGAGANGNWSQSINWAGGVSPVSGDDLVFPAGIPAASQDNSNNQSDRNYHSISIQEGGYVAAGNEIALNAGLTASHTTGVVTWAPPLFLTLPQTFTFAGETTLTGDISTAGSDLTIASSAPLVTISGVISGGGGIIYDGTGTVRVPAAHTFTGPCAVNAGKVEMRHASAFGSAAAGTTINSGGEVVLFSDTVGILENFTLAGRLTTTNSNARIDGTLTTAGTAEQPARIHCDAAVRLTLTGVLDEMPGTAAVLTKTGPGELRLGGSAPNFLDSIAVEEGTLHLANTSGMQAVSGVVNVGTADGPAALLVLGRAGQLPVGGGFNVQASGTVDLGGQTETHQSMEMRGGTVMGAGSLTLSLGLIARASNTTATIAAALNCGSLQVDHSATSPELIVSGALNSAPPGGTVLISGGGHVRLMQPSPALQLTNGGVVEVTSATPGGPVTMNGGRLIGAGSVGSITSLAPGGIVDPGVSPVPGILAAGAISWNGNTTSAFEIHDNTPGTGHDQLAVTGTISLGGAFLVPATLPGYTGDVGTQFVIIDNDGADAISGTFASLPAGGIVDGGGAKFSVSYTGGTGNDVVLTVVQMDGTSVVRFWDGGDSGISTWTSPVNWVGNVAPNPGDHLVFPADAPRQASTNSFPAGTTFDYITVQGTGYQLSGNLIHLNGGIRAEFPSGTFTLALPVNLTGAQTFLMAGTGLFDGAPSAGINTNGHILTCQTGTANSQIRVRSIVTGAGGLTKTGPGDLLLEGSNTYSGLTTVAEGFLSITSPSSLGSTAAGTAVAAGAELRNFSFTTFTTPENISLSGMLRVGTVFQQFTGNIDLPAGATGTITSLGGGLTVNGAISGAGSLRTAASFLNTSTALTGTVSNTFTGGCTVESGTLSLSKSGGAVALRGPVTIGGISAPAQLWVQAPNQILDTATVTVSGPGASFECRGFPETIAHLQMTGGTVSSTSPGALTVTGTMTTHPAATSATLAGEYRLPFQGGEYAWNVADGPAPIDLMVTAAITAVNQGVLVKRGTGRADLTSTPGIFEVVVPAGRANFNGNHTGTNVQLRGGTVGGTGQVGSITDPFSMGGTVAPGLSPGRLGCLGVTMNALTTFQAELNGLSVISQYDLLSCSGSQLNNAALDLSLGFTPAVGDSFTILENTLSASVVGGTFAGLPQGAYLSEPGAQVFQISYTGGTGNDVVLMRVDVPDPVITSSSAVPGTGPNAGHVVITAAVTGTPGLTYVLEESADLAAWTPVASRTAAPDGAMTFEFNRPESLSRLYIRIRLP